VLGALMGVQLAILLGAINTASVATALPQIANDLNGFQQLSWVVTSYLVAATVAIPLYGALSDVYGRRRLFVVAILLSLAGSILCGFAQSVPELIAFRAVQGFGGGGLVPLGLAAIGDLFPPRERGRYQAYISVTFSLAAVVGPLLGGILTDQLSWRWVFFMNIPLAIAALVAVLLTIRDGPVRRRHRVDLTGAATLSAGLTSLLLVIVWGGQTYPWGSAVIVGLTAAAVVLLAAFVAIERRAAEPILPLGLFRDRVVLVMTLVALLFGGVLFTIIVYVPVFAQGALGTTATLAGLLLIPLEIVWSATSVTTGRLIARTGRYRVFPTIGMAFLLVATLLLVLAGGQPPYARVALILILVGIGNGLSMQVTVIAVQNAVPRARMGAATALNQLSIQLGGVLATAAFGTILARRFSVELHAQLGARADTIDISRILRAPGDTKQLAADLVPIVRTAMGDAFHWVFTGALVVALIAFVTVLFLREVPLRRTHELDDASLSDIPTTV
jgi:EmrB/QacA subfamily drug resistance transporter